MVANLSVSILPLPAQPSFIVGEKRHGNLVFVGVWFHAMQWPGCFVIEYMVVLQSLHPGVKWEVLQLLQWQWGQVWSTFISLENESDIICALVC